MKKKMISLFLCGMMAVTAIVGCGGSGETKSEESGSEVAPIAIPYKSPETLIKWGFPAFFHEMKKLKYSLFFSLS